MRTTATLCALLAVCSLLAGCADAGLALQSQVRTDGDNLADVGAVKPRGAPRRLHPDPRRGPPTRSVNLPNLASTHRRPDRAALLCQASRRRLVLRELVGMKIRIVTFAVGAVVAAGIGMAGTGMAAASDLPARPPPTPYVAPVPVFTWTGAYFGVNAGASFDQNMPFHLYDGNGLTLANQSLGTIRPEHFHDSDSGFTAGGQVGYNYQFTGLGAGLFGPNSGIVVGAEADASYIDGGTSGTYTGLNAAGTTSANNTFRSGIDYLGTVRGRVGYGFDRLLVYGTGGFAYGDAFQSAALYTAGNPSLLRYFGSHSGIQTGYTYGGGVEYALPTASFLNVFHSSAITVKAEYLHYDLGHANFAADGLTTTTAYAVRSKTEGDIARAGLNYKF